MDDTELFLQKPQSVPFFLRALAILILISGIIGFLFYGSAVVYYFSSKDFLFDQQYKGFGGSAYYFILVLQMILNGGLFVSAIFLLKLKKSGLYIFTISYLIFALLSYFLQDDYGWTIPIIGFIMLTIIFLHKNLLRY